MVKILIVDDHLGMRKMMRRVLRSKDFLIDEAEDGAIACKAFEKTIYYLVIMDIFMPNKDGFELIICLKGNHPDVKFIAISGGAQKGAVSYFDAATYTLEKPFYDEQLLDAVNKTLALVDRKKDVKGHKRDGRATLFSQFYVVTIENKGRKSFRMSTHSTIKYEAGHPQL
jgi:DNA-binding NtrC family response regulator